MKVGSNQYTGFQGTEFKFPILYAIKGVTDPKQIQDSDDHFITGREHIDSLWKNEIEESLEVDKNRYFITDDAFRSLCVGLNEGSNGWALLIGQASDDQIVKLEHARARSSGSKFFVYDLSRTQIKWTLVSSHHPWILELEICFTTHS